MREVGKERNLESCGGVNREHQNEPGVTKHAGVVHGLGQHLPNWLTIPM